MKFALIVVLTIVVTAYIGGYIDLIRIGLDLYVWSGIEDPIIWNITEWLGVYK